MALPSYAMNQTSFPEMYERQLVGPLFRPWAELMLDEVGLSPGDRLLDIACGTGIVARTALERLGEGARVVGVDLNPDMLALARAVQPAIDWREGNAMALPLGPGDRFDVVTCQQGLQFVSDRPAAVAEMRRALADGGRIAVATWRPDDEVPFMLAMRQVAEGRLGPVADHRHGFGDGAALEKLLVAAGFRDVRVRTASLIMRFEDGASMVRMNTTALVGMSAAGKLMSDQQRREAVDQIVRDSAPVAERFRDGDGLAFELKANLALARG